MDEAQLAPEIRAHYEAGSERGRLLTGGGSLELVRTQALLRRFLPPPPAAVLDVGGGPGVYAAWLARDGYTVRLVDPVPLHVEQAQGTARAQPERPFTAVVGDARRLEEPEGAYDAVLLLGPLYHLTERGERLAALGEARRVVRPRGRVVAAAISRFAGLLDGLRCGWLADPAFRRVVEADLRTGQHRNPDPEHRPEWFTTAYFHRPEEVAAEVAAAGLQLDALLGVEGPGWLFWRERWDDPQHRAALVDAAQAAEEEPSLLGTSAHLMAVARRPG